MEITVTKISNLTLSVNESSHGLSRNNQHFQDHLFCFTCWKEPAGNKQLFKRRVSRNIFFSVSHLARSPRLSPEIGKCSLCCKKRQHAQATNVKITFLSCTSWHASMTLTNNVTAFATQSTLSKQPSCAAGQLQKCGRAGVGRWCAESASLRSTSQRVQFAARWLRAVVRLQRNYKRVYKAH